MKVEKKLTSRRRWVAEMNISTAFSMCELQTGFSEVCGHLYVGGAERRGEERNEFGLIITSEGLGLKRGGDVQRRPDITGVRNI